MKHRIRFVRSMSLLLALVLLFTMSPLSVIAVSGADAEETTSERGAPEMSSPTSTPTEGTPAENGLVLVDEAIHFLDEKAGGIRELTSLREESVKYFVLTNGKYAALTYPAPVHRKDRSGVWQDIDNNLSLQSVKNVQFYATSDLRVVFSQDLASSGQLFSLNENGYEIGMSMDTAQLETGELLPILPTEPSLVTVTNAPAKSGDSYYDSLAEAAAVNNAASIRYSNVKANTDLEYVLTGNAVKENIIVKARGTSYVYRFTLTLSGLTPTLLKSGVISLNDTVSGARKYIIPAPFMYDAAGNRSEDVAYALTKKSDGTYLLTVTASAAWINESDRAFPVTIDPTIYQQGAAEDTYINYNYPENFNGDASFFTVSEEDTAYVRIPLPELPENAVIDTASMYLIKESGYGSVYISARQVLGDWDEYEMTPSYAPAYSSTALSAQTVYASSGTYFGFNITSAARAWLAGTANNYGIAFVGSAIVDECISFQASDAGYYDENDMAGPYLYVEYSETIPEGVYSFRNLHNSDYMSIQNNNPWAGGLLVTKQHSETSPTTEFARESLFKLSHVAGYTYILRSMLNNNITLGIDSDGNVITKAIPSDDDDVSIYDTFTIINVDGYYQLIPQNASSSYIGTNWDNSHLAELDYSDYSESDQTKWTLTRYSGKARYGYSLYSFSSTGLVGSQMELIPAVWSTTVRVNIPSMSIPSEYATKATGTWNSSTGKFVVNLHDDGFIKCEITIYKGIRIYSSLSSRITVTLPMAEGTYYIQNLGSALFMEVESASAAVGAAIQQAAFHGEDHSKWHVIHVSDGYYRIQSVHSGMYVAIDTEDYFLITQTNANTDYALWQFEETTAGNYFIICKGALGSYRAVAAENSINGSNLIAVDCINNANYFDEWNLTPCYSYTINFYYDHAFNTRYPNADELILSFSDEIKRIFRESFCLTVTINDPILIYSTPDLCKLERNLPITSTTINDPAYAMCPANPSLENPSCPYFNENAVGNSDCENCTSWYQALRDFIRQYPGTDFAVSVLFTGSKLYNEKGEGCNRSLANWGYNGIILQELFDPADYYEKMLPFVIHEISHQFEAPDHYHEDILDENGTPTEGCYNSALCFKCNPTTGRPEWCIMSDCGRDDLSTSDPESIYCSECYNEILAYIENCYSE